MPQNHDDNVTTFRALYPEISDAAIAGAYENFQRYVQLAVEVGCAAETTRESSHLTDTPAGGSVSVGQVDPIRTFTNTG